MYCIAPPDPSWPAKEQRDYLPGQADLLFTSVHEVWPGHFLQFLHSNRNPSIVGRLFVGYAFAEGWAHYGEETMGEMGIGEGLAGNACWPELTTRCCVTCGYCAAIGLHTRGMTVERSPNDFQGEGSPECGDCERAGHTPGLTIRRI